MSEPGARRLPWARVGAILALLAFTVLTLVTGLLPAREDHDASQRMLDEQESRNRELEKRQVALEAEAQAVATDPWVVQRILRDEFHVTDEDEVLVR